MQIALWFQANGFMLNQNKTQELYFSLRNSPIDNCLTHVKFLGVLIDCKLSWEYHIDYITGKLSRVIFLLKQLKNHVSDHYVRTAYFAFFQSIVTYGIVLWGNCSRMKEILLLQKKIIRIMMNADRLAHCKPFFIELKILTVVNLYIYSVLLYTKNNLPYLHQRRDIHLHNTRSSNKLNLPYCRLSTSLNSYKSIGMRIYNKLPSSMVNTPLEQFKNNMFDWLVSRPFYSLQEFFATKM